MSRGDSSCLISGVRSHSRPFLPQVCCVLPSFILDCLNRLRLNRPICLNDGESSHISPIPKRHQQKIQTRSSLISQKVKGQRAPLTSLRDQKIKTSLVLQDELELLFLLIALVRIQY